MIEKCWTFQDDTAAAPPNAGTELWHNLAGIQLDSPNYTVGFNGTLNLDATGIPPQSAFGLLSDSAFTPIPYAGSVTVKGTLNADASATATNDHALLGFMNDVDPNGYQDGYLMFISPTWHYVALYSIKDVGSASQTVLRLDIAEPYGLGHIPNPGDPLMDQPIECTMQIEMTPGGNVRISGRAWGDIGGGSQELVELDFLVGVDSPKTSGNDPPGTYPASAVPKIYGGAVGVVGAVTVDVPTPLDIAVDDYASWTSLPGDFDLDGDVDVTDLGTLATNYNLVTGATVFQGDTDFDGLVNVNDLGDLATNYGTDVWPAGAAVPEPATMTMLVLGALALLIRRRG